MDWEGLFQYGFNLAISQDLVRLRLLDCCKKNGVKYCTLLPLRSKPIHWCRKQALLSFNTHYFGLILSTYLMNMEMKVMGIGLKSINKRGKGQITFYSINLKFHLLLMLSFLMLDALKSQSNSTMNDAPLNAWMSSLNDDVSVGALTIPGTHDSGSKRGAGILLKPYFKTQNWTIAEQLENGIRFLDIRCRREGERFLIYHDIMDQHLGFDEVLNDCSKFLSAHPSEIILMRIKEEKEPKNSSQSFQEIFAKYKNQQPDLWYDKWEIPTVQAARGKIVIVDNANLGEGIPYPNLIVQDMFELTKKKDKWPYVKAQLDIAKGSSKNDVLYVNYFNANGIRSKFSVILGSIFRITCSPKDFSKTVNPNANTYLKTNPQGRYGILVMDFPTVELIERMVRANGELHKL